MKTYLLFITCLINYSLKANTPDVSVPYKFTKEGGTKTTHILSEWSQIK